MEQLSAEEERALLERARRGDESAWRELVSAYMEPLVGFLYNYLGNEEDAKDVAQEALARAIAHLDEFHGKNRFSTWLFAIGANRAKDVLKSADNRRSHSVGEFSEAMELRDSGRVSQPDDETIEKEMLRELQVAVHGLPEKLRACFILYYFENLSFDEIAQVLKTTRGGIKVQISRAREQLARRNPQLYEYLKR